jgi:hypothetical protein
MSTVKEIEARFRKEKREKKELEKVIEEMKLRETFYQERLDNWAEKNAELRERVRTITVDEILAIRKSESLYTQERELSERLEHQEKIRVDGNLSR